MAIPSLSIDKLRNEQNAKITIVMSNQGKRVAVTGFTMGEFSVSGNSSYTNPFENSAQESLGQKINQVATAANSALGTNFGQFQFKNLKQTASLWTASSKPSFNINLLFVQLRAVEAHGSSVFEPIKKLNASIYPIVDGAFKLRAPLGYTITNDTPANTSTLKIGRWFLARNLIVTAVNSTFSQEVVANGTPLYAQAQITFEPYRAVDINTVNKWFRTGR